MKLEGFCLAGFILPTKMLIVRCALVKPGGAGAVVRLDGHTGCSILFSGVPWVILRTLTILLSYPICFRPVEIACQQAPHVICS